MDVIIPLLLIAVIILSIFVYINSEKMNKLLEEDAKTIEERFELNKKIIHILEEDANRLDYHERLINLLKKELDELENLYFSKEEN